MYSSTFHGAGRDLLNVEASPSYSDTPPLDEGSVRLIDFYLTDSTQQTGIHARSGIRTRNPSKRTAVDSRLRRHGHWNKPRTVYKDIYIYIYIYRH